MIRALALAAGDMLRPRIFGVVLLGVALTLALFVALQYLLFQVIGWWAPSHIHLPLIGQVAVARILSWGSLALFPVVSFFLMAPVAAGFSGLFTDQVARQVESVHYPTRMGRDLSFWAGLAESGAVIALVLVISVVVLIASAFIGPLAPLLGLVANGWLLGREFFQMAAARHLPHPQATALRQRVNTQVTLTGIAIAALLTVPVVNIAVPVLATAAFTHLLHRFLGSSGPSHPYRRG